MKKIVFSAALLLTSLSIIAQGGWSWTEKANMPMRTGNNGLASVKIADTTFSYSFAGIDSTKSYSGIHTKAFKYNDVLNTWSSIPDLPDSLGGVIASSATTIKDKIYIIGGYHVYANHSEISSYEVHIFDPVTETYSRGTNLPTAIDDHVHFAYNDSLIYIITGWTSDLNPDQNTNEVQIYNPSMDTWTTGTATPDNNSYKCFGGSGALLGNTIYYGGGADHTSFGLRNVIRKGEIDASDPTQITWTLDTANPGTRMYRSAALTVENSVYWIGGAIAAYNYDGLSYSSNAPVDPSDRILEWNPGKRKFYEHTTTPFKVMDLRNIVQISPTRFIIAGGILEDTTVSNKTFLLEYDTSYVDPSDSLDTTGLSSYLANGDHEVTIYPNPTTKTLFIRFEQFMEKGTYQISNLAGQVILTGNFNRNLASQTLQINTSNLANGSYFLTLQNQHRKVVRKIVK